MNTKIIYPIIIILTGILMGCSRDEITTLTEGSSTILTIESPPFTQEEDGYDMHSAWEERDKIQGFIEQGGAIYSLGDLVVFDLDKSWAKIRLNYPKGMDKAKPFTFYGVYGREGYISQEQKTLAFSGREELSQDLSTFKPRYTPRRPLRAVRTPLSYGFITTVLMRSCTSRIRVRSR